MQTRRAFVKHSSIAATGLLALNSLDSIASICNDTNTLAANKNSITILHTGNILQQLQPMSITGLHNGLGGFEQMATIIKSQKNKYKNVLLLDAGNATSNKNDASETLQLMQSLGYDAVKIAANEINFNALQLNNIGKKLPLVASNYTFDNKLNVASLPFSIFQKGAYKVAVITAGQRVRNKVINFKNPIAEANKLAATLKNEYNCNLVVCISTLGYNTKNAKNDITLANSSTHIDVILGADNLMVTPAIVKNTNKEEVVLNYSAPKGLVLGKLQIEFDEEGNKKMVHFDNLMVGTTNQRWKRETA
jgi:5'-nucleotidase